MTCGVAVAVTAAIGTAAKSDLSVAKARYAGLQFALLQLGKDTNVKQRLLLLVGVVLLDAIFVVGA